MQLIILKIIIDSSLVVHQIHVELIPFLVTTATVVLAFAHMFHFIGPPDETMCALEDGQETLDLTQDQFDAGGWTCTWYHSYVSTFHTLLSGDWQFLNDFPPTRQSVLSMFYAFVIGIVLLNMIIAVISIAFSSISENIDQAFWSQRYRFLMGDVISMVSIFDCCGKEKKEDLSNTINTFPDNDIGSGGNKSSYRRRAFLLNPISRIQYIKSNYLDRDIKDFGRWHRLIFILTRGVFLIILIATTPFFFLAGVVTFGILWPRDMKEAILFGPTTRRIETTLTVNEKNTKRGNSLLEADSTFLSTKFDELSTQNDQLMKDNEQLKEDNRQMKNEVSEIRSMLEFLTESRKSTS